MSRITQKLNEKLENKISPCCLGLVFIIMNYCNFLNDGMNSQSRNLGFFLSFVDYLSPKVINWLLILMTVELNQ